MHSDVENDGWQRFLERLKQLWGKVRGVGPASLSADKPIPRNGPQSCRTRCSPVRNIPLQAAGTSAALSLGETIGWVSRPELVPQLSSLNVFRAFALENQIFITTSA